MKMDFEDMMRTMMIKNYLKIEIYIKYSTFYDICKIYYSSIINIMLKNDVKKM